MIPNNRNHFDPGNPDRSRAGKARRTRTGNTSLVVVILMGILIVFLVGVIIWLVASRGWGGTGESQDITTAVSGDATDIRNETTKLEPPIAPGSGESVNPDEPTTTPASGDSNENQAAYPDEPTATPTPEPTATPTPEPEEPEPNGFTVAIDAGHQLHGDSDPEPIGPGASETKARVSDGAAGVSSRVPEYELNLQIAKKLRKILLKRGYQVFMVRKKNDVSISNKERAEAINESGADICIRIHADSIDSSEVRGASALYPSEDNPYVPELAGKSKKLSDCVLDAYCKKTGIKSRGCIIRNDLTGTNWSTIPVTLIEMGFLSNPEEDELMQDNAFRKTMAVGMANGIDEYFGLK